MFRVLAFILAFQAGTLAAKPLNRIVATVNDNVVLESELINRETMIIDQLRQQNAQLPPQAALRKQVLDRLIIENLQLQLAERSGVRIDDETLNKNLQTMARQNNMSLDEFRQVLEKTASAMLLFANSSATS